MAKGKKTCKILKEIRRQIAEANDIEYVVEECQYKGDCLGTCPKCEAEVRYLEQQLHQRQLLGKAVMLAGVSVGMFTLSSCKDINRTQGEAELTGDTVIVENPVDSNTVKGNDIKPLTDEEKTVKCCGGILLEDSVKQEEKEGCNPPEMLCPVTDKVYEVVDIMPSFPGGFGKMLEYLTENVKYPEGMEDSDIQGRVVCSFIINTDGSLSDIEIVRSLEPNLDKEALRVVSSMPKWEPGRQNGIPVKVRYVLPVIFKQRSNDDKH